MHPDGRLHIEGFALHEGDAVHLIRRREEVSELFALESTPP